MHKSPINMDHLGLNFRKRGMNRTNKKWNQKRHEKILLWYFVWSTSPQDPETIALHNNPTPHPTQTKETEKASYVICTFVQNDF